MANGHTVATAEATCGGLIGKLLTDNPGSSKVFKIGVAPYWNEVKVRLGVPEFVISDRGAVSREVAEALAQAVRKWAGSTIAVAETGVAGPEGGSEVNPVGTFFIAVADSDGVVSKRVEFAYDRIGNRLACAEAALRMLGESAKRPPRQL
ncbi:MAG TPA: CinA family protein [Dehalococcoidia bacterium]|nr:CinA family protein [Dehalococcoidia bacterium]